MRPPLRQLVKSDPGAAGPPVPIDASLEQATTILARQRSTTGRVMEDQRCVGAVSIFDLVSAMFPPETEEPSTATAGDRTPVVLRFRKIGESQDMLAQFESLEDAKTWLQERPKLVRVLRVEEPDLPTKVEAELHDAMRPLDDEELEAIADVQRKLQQLHSVELRDLQARAERETAHTASKGTDRPFVVRYAKDRALAHADDDGRPIPDGVRQAVLAWVERRNEWMHPRGQHVGAAVLRVPAAIASNEPSADVVEPVGEIEILPGFADADA